METRLNLPVLLASFALVLVLGASIQAQVTVALDPPEASVRPGEQIRFTANVSGARNPFLSWGLGGSLDPEVDLGFISPEGVYTAPRPAPRASVQVVVTVIGGRGGVLCSASAPVRFTRPRQPPRGPAHEPVTLSIIPGRASLVTGGHLQFLASVTGIDEPNVSWAVFGRHRDPEHTGTIAQDGLYHAPNQKCSAEIKVMATLLGSCGEPLARDVVVVDVVEAHEHPGTVRFTLHLNPWSATVEPGGVIRLWAHVDGVKRPRLAWSLHGQGNDPEVWGSIDRGVYRAPAHMPPGPVIVVASLMGPHGYPVASARCRIQVRPPPKERVSVRVHLTPSVAEVFCGHSQVWEPLG